MAALRNLLCVVIAATPVFCLPAAAQLQAAATAAANEADTAAPPRGAWLPGGRNYLGLNLGRSRYSISCPPTSPLCDDSDRSAQLYAGRMIGNFWGVELGYLNLGRVGLPTGEAKAQGLNLSVVGKTQLSPSIRLFGKLGTTYGRTETSRSSSALAGSEQGFGLSYGGGLAFDFTPRLSATLAWDSNDLRMPGGGRDPVRSTSLGLQYRY